MAVSRQSSYVVIAVAVAVAVALAFAGYGWVKYRSMTQLHQTIAAILESRLHLSYELERRIVLDAGPDIDVAWQVTVDAPVDGKTLRQVAPSFALADIADTEYFSKEFSELFATNLESYELYAAEVALGAGTICPVMSCNIKILLRTGDRRMFVRVFKI